MAPDNEHIAREILDKAIYMTLATADEAGTPWASPVYFASADHVTFHWVSSPEVRHSQNIAVRAEVAMTVFDSHAPISTGQAVYMEASAAELTGDEMEAAIEVYSAIGQDDGGRPWSPDDVTGDAPLRLYRATARSQWILDPGDGTPGAGTDRRVPVHLGAQ